jgi:hypothetical protein
VLAALISPSFHGVFIQLPDADIVPPEIMENPKFFPYFKDALGAIDGTTSK